MTGKLISQIFAEIFLSAVLTERFFAKTVKFGVVWWGVVEDEAVQQLERARGLLRGKGGELRRAGREAP